MQDLTGNKLVQNPIFRRAPAGRQSPEHDDMMTHFDW